MEDFDLSGEETGSNLRRKGKSGQVRVEVRTQ